MSRLCPHPLRRTAVANLVSAISETSPNAQALLVRAGSDKAPYQVLPEPVVFRVCMSEAKAAARGWRGP